MRERPVSHALNRRDFLRNLALGAGAVVASSTLLELAGCQSEARQPSAGEKLQIGLVGVGGRGAGNLDGILKTDETIAAICDIDGGNLDKAWKKISDKFPQARRYRDWREMIAKEHELMAVAISTPDHMHAPIASAAMAHGLHVYCEKPLTRTVWEARQLRQLAEARGLATQMGNQGSASPDLRRGVELIQAGLIGQVREVHAWTNRPVWPQGLARPEGSDPIPENLFWDGFLGVAPERPFKKDVYHTFKWRGWHDFGAGAFGDMGCHTLNLPFRALDLSAPTQVEAVAVSDQMPETFPKSSTVRFSFPERHGLPATTLFWYDGGAKPPADRIPEVVRGGDPLGGSGLVLVGDAGVLYSTDDYNTKLHLALKGESKLVDANKHPALAAVPVTLPRALKGHHQEWVDACRGGPAAFSSFAVASRLSELCLLGTIAQRCPGKALAWDSAAMRFADSDAANALVKPTYRSGWTA